MGAVQAYCLTHEMLYSIQVVCSILLGPIDYAFISLRLVGGLGGLVQVEWPALHAIHHTNRSLHRLADKMIWLLELAKICLHFPWRSFGFYGCQLQWPVEIQDGVDACYESYSEDPKVVESMRTIILGL